VKLGAENRKKTYVALGLGLFAVIMVIYRISNPAGTSSSSAPAAPVQSSVDSSSPLSARPTPRRNTGAKPSSTSKKALPAPSIDPTLRLAMLRASEDIKYTGRGRNIFQAQIDIPKVVASPVKQPQVQLPPPGPPPPPPIPLKFFGFANKPGETKRIFLSQGEDVFIAGEGDIVNRRYKVVRIGPSSVEIEDVLNNNRQSIPLTQG
jgi:hypothetical protein